MADPQTTTLKPETLTSGRYMVAGSPARCKVMFDTVIVEFDNGSWTVANRETFISWGVEKADV